MRSGRKTCRWKNTAKGRKGVRSWGWECHWRGRRCKGTSVSVPSSPVRANNYSRPFPPRRPRGLQPRLAAGQVARCQYAPLAARSPPAGRQPRTRESRPSSREQYAYETAHLGRIRAAFEPNEPPPRHGTCRDLGGVCDEKINHL